MLKIDELDEWRTHVKEKQKKHDKEPKRRHDENLDGTNQFKVGYKVLLDKTDPRIATSKLNANESNPLQYRTSSHTVQSRIIDSEKEKLQFHEPP
ncbi:hypothetical protein GOBAR_DD33280 [Gossypium barbadense]|nr:hypothetical protein GOBAR_DD33280 [Gossypium barbadense]